VALLLVESRGIVMQCTDPSNIVIDPRYKMLVGRMREVCQRGGLLYILDE
jgi:hypothetical protein